METDDPEELVEQLKDAVDELVDRVDALDDKEYFGEPGPLDTRSAPTAPRMRRIPDGPTAWSQ